MTDHSTVDDGGDQDDHHVDHGNRPDDAQSETPTPSTGESSGVSRRGALAALGSVGLLGIVSSQPASAAVLSGVGNRAPDATQVVAGGKDNEATGPFAAVLGGLNNRASARLATVGGGGGGGSSELPASVGGGTRPNGNRALDNFTTVAGGRLNQAGSPSGDPTSASFATVSGGQANTAYHSATVSGGRNNLARGEKSTVGGGYENKARGRYSTVGGGGVNIANDFTATVGGGFQNEANASGATVGGGDSNRASDHNATIAGGQSNEASDGNATVGGGYYNKASGGAATVPGGGDNTASGDYSFAAGHEARAEHDGSVVFGDATFTDVSSEGANEFRSQMPMFAPGFNVTSARAKKQSFGPVSPESVLETVTDLEVSTWEYTDTDSGRHMGPMAGAFSEAFGLGDNDETISSIDADGVAFAAIQGLAHRLERKRDEISDLEAQHERKAERIDDLEAETAAVRRANERKDDRIEDLEARLAALEEAVDAPPTDRLTKDD